MKAWILAGLIGAVQCWGATVVAPNGMENLEGDRGAIPLFGGNQQRTQMIYGSQHFSLFPPEGAYIVELRFRIDAGLPPFSDVADMEVRLSTSSQDPNSLSSTMNANVGPDETVVIPRSIVEISGTGGSANGPNSFDVVLPLPTQFYYRPADGNLLIDANVYGIGRLQNFDWDSNVSDGASSAIGSLTTGNASIIDNAAPIVQFVFVPIPEPKVGWLAFIGLGFIVLKKYVFA